MVNHYDGSWSMAGKPITEEPSSTPWRLAASTASTTCMAATRRMALAPQGGGQRNGGNQVFPKLEVGSKAISLLEITEDHKPTGKSKEKRI